MPSAMADDAHLSEEWATCLLQVRAARPDRQRGGVASIWGAIARGHQRQAHSAAIPMCFDKAPLAADTAAVRAQLGRRSRPEAGQAPGRSPRQRNGKPTQRFGSPASARPTFALAGAMTISKRPPPRLRVRTTWAGVGESEEELGELQEAVASGDRATPGELGDVCCSTLVNVAPAGRARPGSRLSRHQPAVPGSLLPRRSRPEAVILASQHRRTGGPVRQANAPANPR